MTKNDTTPNSRTFVPTAAAGVLALLASPEAINSEIVRRDLPVGEGTTEAKTILLLVGVRSQGDFAAQVINLLGPDIDPSDLTQALKTAFPGAKIGSRHGPHYLSHARSGKLSGLRPGLLIPHRQRSKVTPEEIEVKPTTIGELIALHTGKNGRKELQTLAKGLGVKAGGKNIDIADRILKARAAA